MRMDVGRIQLNVEITGEGPALVLLHGWPQSGRCWNPVVELLRERYTLIVPDLPGYGRSDRPADGYEKRAMATDIAGLLDRLELPSAAVIGHDRGARVAHRLCLDHPTRVAAVGLLDIIPTREMLSRMDETIARAYWHWTFLLQPELPEALIRPQNYNSFVGHVLHRATGLSDPFDEPAIESYAAEFDLTTTLADYRAVFQDREDDTVSHLDGIRITAPALIAWGELGLMGRLQTAEIWSHYADTLRCREIAGAGHFLPEEAPQAVADEVDQFLLSVSYR